MTASSPVAAALGHDAAEEALHLARVEGEVGPFDEEVLALPRRRGGLAVVAVAEGDGADPRRRHQPLERRGHVLEMLLQIVDDHLHAAGGVDHDRDVEPDFSQRADVLAEGAHRAERPPGAASAAPHAQPTGPCAGRREARSQIDSGADRRRRPLRTAPPPMSGSPWRSIGARRLPAAWPGPGAPSGPRRALASRGRTGSGMSSSEKICRRFIARARRRRPDPMPNPGPTPRPNPPPIPATSKTTSSARTRWIIAELASATASRPLGAAVESRVSGDVIGQGGGSSELRPSPNACQWHSSPVQAGAQLAGLGAAELDLGARGVAHHQLEAAAEPRNDRLHVLEVDQPRLVGAEEDLRIETRPRAP